MANAIWQATIVDQSGNVLPGAEVEVVNESTGLPAPLFSTRAGTTKSNPFFADANGFAQFYAAPGLYRITATSSGTGTTMTWRYVRLVDVATNEEALAGTAGVLPDAEQVRRNHVAQVANIADLRNLEPAFDGQQCELLGHTVAGIGGGVFYADYSSSAADDNGVTIVTDGDRRWIRRTSGAVSYYDFGAALDGISDDRLAVTLAHNHANATGDMVYQHGGTALLSAGATITVETTCEFTGGFKFKVTDPNNAFIFDIAPEYSTTILSQADVTLSQFTKGATSVASLSAYAYHYAVIESSETALVRSGGQVYTKKSLTVVGENGRLIYPLTETFSSISSITLTPINIPIIEISGFAIETSGTTEFALPVRVSRNCVRFKDSRYIDGGNSADIPVRQLFNLNRCYGVELLNITSDTLSIGRVDYNYVINGECYTGLKISDLHSFEGWAQVDGNYCRDVSIKDSSVYRIGGHFHCYDYDIQNITSHSTSPISISGGGQLRVAGIKIYPSSTVSGPNAIIDVRQDYGAEWDGEIYLSDVTYDVTGVDVAATFYGVHAYLDSSSVTGDYGRDLTLPKVISVKDIYISQNELASNAINFQSVRIGAFGGTLTGGRLLYYPKSVDVQSVGITKQNPSLNNQLQAVLFAGSVAPVDADSEIRVFVQNVSRKDPRLSGLNPYDGGQQSVVNVDAIPNVEFYVSISDCEWLRIEFNGLGRAKILNCLIAAISGSGRLELYNNQYAASSFSGTWKAVVDGGVVRKYLAEDASYKQVGFPNNIEQNFVACKNLFVEVNGSIRSLTQTTSTIQAGFYDPAFFIAP